MDMNSSSASFISRTLRRSKTWQKEDRIPDVITDFMKYSWNRTHYEALSQRANELVKDALKKADVHATTQYRAKTE